MKSRKSALKLFEEAGVTTEDDDEFEDEDEVVVGGWGGRVSSLIRCICCCCDDEVTAAEGVKGVRLDDGLYDTLLDPSAASPPPPPPLTFVAPFAASLISIPAATPLLPDGVDEEDEEEEAAEPRMSSRGSCLLT